MTDPFECETDPWHNGYETGKQEAGDRKLALLRRCIEDHHIWTRQELSALLDEIEQESE